MFMSSRLSCLSLLLSSVWGYPLFSRVVITHNIISKIRGNFPRGILMVRIPIPIIITSPPHRWWALSKIYPNKCLTAIHNEANTSSCLCSMLSWRIWILTGACTGTLPFLLRGYAQAPLLLCNKGNQSYRHSQNHSHNSPKVMQFVFFQAPIFLYGSKEYTE